MDVEDIDHPAESDGSLARPAPAPSPSATPPWSPSTDTYHARRSHARADFPALWLGPKGKLSGFGVAQMLRRSRRGRRDQGASGPTCSGTPSPTSRWPRAEARATSWRWPAGHRPPWSVGTGAAPPTAPSRPTGSFRRGTGYNPHLHVMVKCKKCGRYLKSLRMDSVDGPSYDDPAGTGTTGRCDYLADSREWRTDLHLQDVWTAASQRRGASRTARLGQDILHA